MASSSSLPATGIRCTTPPGGRRIHNASAAGSSRTAWFDYEPARGGRQLEMVWLFGVSASGASSVTVRLRAS